MRQRVDKARCEMQFERRMAGVLVCTRLSMFAANHVGRSPEGNGRPNACSAAPCICMVAVDGSIGSGAGLAPTTIAKFKPFDDPSCI
jgi:hypothetical protein